MLTCSRHNKKETGYEKDYQSAGINRSEGGDERALRVRSNDPLGPEFGDELSRGSHRSIKQGIGGQGIELRKFAIRAPTRLLERKAIWPGTTS
jgi:hypothetical protein